MIITNVKIYTENQRFQEGFISIKDGRFDKIQTGEQSAIPPTEEILDGAGCYAIPGLIDLHFHGCMGDDFCDGTVDAIQRIAQYQASVGVTAIAPATMTLPVPELEAILTVAAQYRKTATQGADLVGINMEGPFISPTKKGAQDPRNITPCDVEICQRFLDASDGLVKFIGIAPEESTDYRSFIQAVKGKVSVSLAHTNADYGTAKAAFDAGASHAVHLYNAMPPFSHRAPGVVGAVYDSPQVMAELIVRCAHPPGCGEGHLPNAGRSPDDLDQRQHACHRNA
ncbi:MAG: N-acetylglucosamine-6-phosphate deacetylase [Blautia sp.]